MQKCLTLFVLLLSFPTFYHAGRGQDYRSVEAKIIPGKVLVITPFPEMNRGQPVSQFSELLDSKAEELIYAELFAWGIYERERVLNNPKDLHEEMILTCLTKAKFCNIHVVRRLAFGFNRDDAWTTAQLPEPGKAPAIQWYDARPESDEIIKFMEKTNFGNNHYEPDIAPLDVQYFPNPEEIGDCIKKMSNHERQSRYRKIEKAIWTKFHQTNSNN